MLCSYMKCLYTLALLYNLLYKAEKPSVRPSVCLSVRLSDRHAGNSVISAWIDVELGLCRAVVSGMCTQVSISF